MKHPPREGDLPREELVKAAEQAIGPKGQWPGAELLFKFTCKHCGERCCLEEPNKLYEYGDCCACGRSTKIEFGGFMVHYVVGKAPESAGYELIGGGIKRGIKCNVCGRTSWHHSDVEQRYCGHCHIFHEKGQQ